MNTAFRGNQKLGVEKLPNGQEVHCYKLDNGQRVMIAPMNTPKTTINTYVNTGSMNEKDSERGISHYNEHMVFNGTLGSNGYMKLGVGDVFRKVEEMGGYTNACTGTAQTSYTISVPSANKSSIEEAIKIQSAMLNDSAMTDEMVNKEHYPVCSEINMYSDVIGLKANNIATKNLYGIQSTSEDLVAGRVDNIKNIDHKKVMDYYKNNYFPSNMTTVITGNVNPDDAIKMVDNSFTAKNPENVERRFEKLNPIIKTVRYDTVSPKAKGTSATIAFNGPENTNMKDQLALELAFDILFNKSNSRITAPLRDINSTIEPNISKFGTLPTDGQVITFDIDTNEKYSEKALKKVFQELNSFKIKDAEELESVKLKKLSKHQDKYEDVEDVNMLLGSNSFDFSTKDITKLDETIKSLTVDDVESAVKKYLDTSKASIAVVHPTTVTQESLTNNYNLSFKGRIQNEKPMNVGNISQTSLGNNYKIAVYNTPTNSNAKFGIKYTPQKPIQAKPGTIELLNRMLSVRTQNKTINQYGDYLDKYGISQMVDITNDGTIKILGNMPNTSIEPFIKITQELLMTPAFNDEVLKNEKDVIKDLIKSSQADTMQGITKPIYGDSPMGYTSEEILANLDNVTVEDVKNLYNDIMSNSTATVAVATQLNNKTVSTINNLFARMPMAQKMSHPASYFKQIEKSTVTKFVEPNAQADIIQAYNFKTTNNLDDELKFTLMNQILSKGDTTGLFNNLREKEKLAYAVNSNYETIGDNSIIYCRIMTTTDNSETNEHTYENVQKSINGFTNQINKMKNGEFTEKELEVAKKELKIALKDNSYSQSQKRNVLLKGLNTAYGVDYVNKKFEAIDKITKQDIQNAANYVFSNKPVYSITASKNTLDANKEFFETLIK